MAVNDLTGCAKLLTHMMLDQDIQKPPTGRKKSAIKKEKLKIKSKKTPAVQCHRMLTGQKTEDEIINQDIERIIKIKRALQNKAALNEPIDDSVEAPYNQRLASSTPDRSPVRTLLMGDIDSHAINSFEFLQSSKASSQPQLRKGHVDFQPNPNQNEPVLEHSIQFPPRSAFIQQHLAGMREAYMNNLNPRSQQCNQSAPTTTKYVTQPPVVNLLHKPNMQEADSANVYISSLPSTLPAPIVMSGNPPLVSHLSHDGKAYFYNLPQQSQTTGSQPTILYTASGQAVLLHPTQQVSTAVHEPAERDRTQELSVVSTAVHEPAERDRTQGLSVEQKVGEELPSYVRNLVVPSPDQSQQILNKDMKTLDDKGPIAPFKPGIHSMKTLDDKGPIAPFKPGIHGFSAFQETASSSKEVDDPEPELDSTLVSAEPVSLKASTGRGKKEKNKKGRTTGKVLRKNASHGAKVAPSVKHSGSLSSLVKDGSKSKIEVKAKNKPDVESLNKKSQQLVRELKLLYANKLEKEGRRVLKDLEEVVYTLAQNWETELNLTVQPLRRENSELRRKLRITSQQVKDKDKQLEEAEKSDPNYMTAHLQMKVYNLENEVKSLKQLNSKLRDEVHAYLQELERVAAERAHVMQLLSDKQESSLGMSQRSNPESVHERDRLQLQMELMKANYRHKEAELAKTHYLIRSLESSLTLLIQDLQSPEASVHRLSEHLQQVHSVVSQRSRRTYEDLPPTPSPAPATFRSSARSRYTEDTSPGTRKREARSVSADRSGIKNDLEVLQSRAPRSHSHHREAVTLPQTNPAEKVSLFLMDKPGSLSSENEVATNPGKSSMYHDSDITDYQLYPGMSPLDKLDPFIKDLVCNQKLKTEGETHRFKSPSEPLMRGRTDRFISPSEPLMRDVSRGLTRDNVSRVSDSKDTVSSAPTVKELLTPIADRIERFRNLSDAEGKSGAVRALNFDEPPKQPTLEQKAAVNLDDTYDMDLEGDLDKLQYEISSEEDASTTTTFSEKSNVACHSGAGDASTVHALKDPQGVEESRYSVTDYFRKYPCNPSTETQQSAVRESCDTREKEETSGEGTGDNKPPQHWAHKVLISPHGIPVIFDEQTEDMPDQQRTAGKGMEVGCRRAEDSDSTLETATDASISSVDDQMFRRGLANLDANIARVQQQLCNTAAINRPL